MTGSSSTLAKDTVMLRTAALALLLVSAAMPAWAVDFGENDQGQIEFTMPSGNIGCIYTPAGGTNVYEPVGGGPELSCDRVEPAYVRVTLGPGSKAERFNMVGDASCCGTENTFDYGEVWKHDGFRCTSSASGLTCKRRGHGFSMSRKAIKTW
jgi:hypothetical protein